MISYSDFAKVEIRVGRIVRADVFPEARKPAYKLILDFGPEIGQRSPFVSDVLTLGVPDSQGAVVLLAPDADVPIGGKMF